MKHVILALPVLVALSFVQCKEKNPQLPETPAAPAPAKNKLRSGIYQGSRAGTCLCIDAERGFAGDADLIGLSGGPFDSENLPSLMAEFKERFKEVKQQGAEQVSYYNATYTLVDKAKDCNIQENPIPQPVSYQDFCLKGKFPQPRKDM